MSYISVIICTYNRDKYIYHVLESLAQNDYPREGFEIVVVYNNCTDNTSSEVARFASSYPDVCLRCFNETEQGLSYARNRGLREARGDILIYVDDDAFVGENYLSGYAELFERRKDISAAGGPVIPYYESGSEPDWMTFHLRCLLTGYVYFGEKERDFPGDKYPCGCNSAFRASVFEKTGPYNVNLGRKGNDLGGGEEKDIFRKMEMAGLKYIYTPACRLYHSIPKYKVEPEYFDRVTCGIGESEKIRTLNISRAEYHKRLLKEVVKWGGTLVLWVKYALTLKPECGNKLVRFRWNVTKRLLG